MPVLWFSHKVTSDSLRQGRRAAILGWTWQHARPTSGRVWAPWPEALWSSCVFLFQALYWSIRSEKLEWAV